MYSSEDLRPHHAARGCGASESAGISDPLQLSQPEGGHDPASLSPTARDCLTHAAAK